MAVAKPAPSWLVPGGEVYELSGRGSWDGYNITRVLVLRLTATQVVAEVRGREKRYRLDDLKLIGDHRHSAPLLAGPEDASVVEAKTREVVRDAMRGLAEVHGRSTRGARIHTTDLAQARGLAEEFRAAAQFALDNLPTQP